MRIGVNIPMTAEGGAAADALREATEWCTLAEKHGYDFGLVGHHRFTSGYNASPWVLLAALAARTTTLRLGTGIFLLPLDHPLNVAEQVATLDQVSGGRAILGAGLGYRRYEWDALQLPYEYRGARMSEALEVVQRAWTEPRVSFHGAQFAFDDVEVLPKPRQQPRPPVWIGANVGPGIRRAARLGDAWMVGFGDRLTHLETRVDEYRREAAAHGRAGEVCVMRLVGIGPTRQQVEDEWLPFVLSMLRGYRRAGAPGRRNEEASRQLREAGGRSSLDSLGDDMLVAGTPDDVIAGLNRCRQVTGCEHLVVSLVGPNAREALDLFGREVIPAFAEQLTTAG